MTKQLNDESKYRIIILHEEGMTISQISDKLKIHRHTVSKWINRKYELGNLNRIKGSGRKCYKKNDNIVNIMEKLSNNKFLTLEQIKEKLENEDKIKLSLYKIRDILINLNFEYGIPPKRFPLTAEHKQQRLDFAIKYLDFDWTKVLFTDETTHWINMIPQKRWFNKNNINDYDIVHKHLNKRNIWGIICYEFKDLYIFSENMNAEKYINILKEKIIPNYKQDYYLLFDNDPKHKSKKAMKFIMNNNIKYIKFPPNSPDLNPIENIWSLNKNNVKSKISVSCHEFEEIIYDEWEKIDQCVIINTINSMKERLNKVIINQGGYID